MRVPHSTQSRTKNINYSIWNSYFISSKRWIVKVTRICFFDIFKHEHVRSTVEAETDNIIIGLDVIEPSDDDRCHPK